MNQAMALNKLIPIKRSSVASRAVITLSALLLLLSLSSASTYAQSLAPGIPGNPWLSEQEKNPSYYSGNAVAAARQTEPYLWLAKLSYRHDRFTDIFDPWNFIEFDLRKKTSLGSVIGRVTYANRFSRNGVQYEVDAYPSLADGLYAYLNAGFSNSSIFPDYRLGFNLYKSLPHSLEADAGLRYLDFGSSNVTILTAALSKYYGNYFFTARTYITPKTAGTSTSFSLQARRYIGGAENYLNLRIGYGSAQEELQFQELTRRQNSWSISLRAQWDLSERFQIRGLVGYDYEEFPNFDRKRYSFETSLGYRF